MYAIAMELPSGELVLCSEVEDELTVFESRAEAEALCANWMVPYQILEVEWLH